MIRLFIGSFAAAIAMFITGFIFFATPLSGLSYAGADEAQSAAVQAALAANLPATGTYLVPDPTTQSGTTLYGKGPVATVHYNSSGFAVEDMAAIGWGFLHELLVCFVLAWALSRLDRRVPDFASRAQLVAGFAIAGAALICLGEPIWMHQDWSFALYNFIANAAMLMAGGLVLARWFMPVAAVMPEAVTPAA